MKKEQSVVSQSCLKAGGPPSARTCWGLGFLPPPAVAQGPAESPSPGSLLKMLTLRPTRDLLIQSLHFTKTHVHSQV